MREGIKLVLGALLGVAIILILIILGMSFFSTKSEPSWYNFVIGIIMWIIAFIIGFVLVKILRSKARDL